MGCQIGVTGNPDIELRYSRGARAAWSLTDRWRVDSRDCDPDPRSPTGYGEQNQIDTAAMAALDADAPRDLDGFRSYCLTHAYMGDELDDDDLRQIREFIEQAAKAGKRVWLSY
jgi:hypothetical protein